MPRKFRGYFTKSTYGLEGRTHLTAIVLARQLKDRYVLHERGGERVGAGKYIYFSLTLQPLPFVCLVI
jgi:hypothetical protein